VGLRWLAFTAVALLVAGSATSSCDSPMLDRMHGGNMSEAREAVRKKLKDPDSAKFDDLQVCPGNIQMVTGHVNAKNAFGAYTGSVSFFAAHSVAVFYANALFDDFARDCYAKDPIWKDYLTSIPADSERYQSR